MAHPYSRGAHPKWVGRAKLADGGPVEGDKPTFGDGNPGAWDYFKAGAKDQAASMGRMLRGDLKGDPMEYTKEVYKSDKRK